MILVSGRTSEEYERLRRQSKFLEPVTRSVLDRAGLASGMRCLDVGCGPGEVMRLMAETVGPAGQVVGIDCDAGLGREALSVLMNKGYKQCSFIEGNAESLDQIDSGPFDLVFARLLLMHLDDWCVRQGGQRDSSGNQAAWVLHRRRHWSTRWYRCHRIPTTVAGQR